jgi:hypothetical protein
VCLCEHAPLSTLSLLSLSPPPASASKRFKSAAAGPATDRMARAAAAATEANRAAGAVAGSFSLRHACADTTRLGAAASWEAGRAAKRALRAGVAIFFLKVGGRVRGSDEKKELAGRCVWL